MTDLRAAQEFADYPTYEIGETAAIHLRTALAAAKDEKRRRVYYQNIVYAICTHIDKHRGDGSMIQCGTLDHPSSALQDAVGADLACLAHRLPDQKEQT